jgi:hypothetical protein
MTHDRSDPGTSSALMSQLWLEASDSRARWFLVPPEISPRSGEMCIRNLQGASFLVDPDALDGLEIPEDQALRLVRQMLGDSLVELREVVDERLDRVRKELDETGQASFATHPHTSNDAGPAFLEMLKCLPHVIGNSLAADARRVEDASRTMQRLHQRLHRAGIHVNSSFTNFPSRLAQLRADFDARRRK